MTATTATPMPILWMPRHGAYHRPWGVIRRCHIKGISFARKGGGGRTTGWRLRWTETSASWSNGSRQPIHKFFLIGSLPRNISPKPAEEHQWLNELADRDKKCFNDAVRERARLESSGQACLAGRPDAAGAITFSHKSRKKWLKKKTAALRKRPAAASYTATVLRRD